MPPIACLTHENSNTNPNHDFVTLDIEITHIKTLILMLILTLILTLDVELVMSVELELAGLWLNEYLPIKHRHGEKNMMD